MSAWAWVCVTILALAAMAQAETWAREWYEKRQRTRKAEARLARIHRRLEARADAFAFELSEDVRQYRHRRAAALKVGGGDNIAAQVAKRDVTIDNFRHHFPFAACVCCGPPSLRRR